MTIQKIISGGQAGVDRAALDLALELKIPCGGWCPKGRLAEDGIISEHYPLQETKTAEYPERTFLNVQNSDGTLIIAFGELSDGTAYTLECVKKLQKPRFIIQAGEEIPTAQFYSWTSSNNIEILNIAGPRESQQPGVIYQKTKNILLSLLKSMGF